MSHNDPWRKRDVRYDEELRTEAARLYAERPSLAHVANKMGISRERARVLCHEAGVDLRPPGRPPGGS